MGRMGPSGVGRIGIVCYTIPGSHRAALRFALRSRSPTPDGTIYFSQRNLLISRLSFTQVTAGGMEKSALWSWVFESFRDYLLRDFLDSEWGLYTIIEVGYSQKMASRTFKNEKYTSQTDIK